MARERERIAARIAMLESHQEGRRAHIAATEELIERKQMEIDNLRSQQDPPPSQRAVQLWSCEDAACE